ncbi:MAG: hypothetical protein NTW21_28640 [Verrucomicrobia bacterium]|nr:hypothetical protein [Verrucomicrobiota bacterium]
MRFTKIINQAALADLLSAMISCLTLVLTAGTSIAAQPGNWYEKSRVGLFVHYVPELTVFPAGGSTTDINSVANGFEYLHVLNPPTGTTLHLPVPADAKKFPSATMLVSGRAATLVQDATGMHIKIPEAWDPLNTVIKLAAR